MKKNLVKITNASLALTMLLVSLPINTKALTRDETVYSKIENNGEVKSIYVNEHLINNEKINDLKDYTELKEIFNLNGDEKLCKEYSDIKDMLINMSKLSHIICLLTKVHLFFKN